MNVNACVMRVCLLKDPVARLHQGLMVDSTLSVAVSAGDRSGCWHGMQRAASLSFSETTSGKG